MAESFKFICVIIIFLCSFIAAKNIDGRNNPTRRNWSELVGVTAEEAERKIKEEMNGVEIRVVPPGYFVTADYNTQRVRLYVDQSNKLIKTPTIG
ncbi:putative proteinase inhibitor I13, potato inhibitor I [Medicago truncatula]|uniref:Nodule Cysteine-Rich (NCR) secreted peptide n=1 Tax=Medicago truncatula TaxID=3880 RepID=G7IW93_MEDTR|nr:subtilisin inhibitor CLSI-I [Medicago truncatula]AES69036.1 Nodule Cysteine-Rich (NCR) secreted peptide [Medicago truncatula]AFK43503.1 unknown [Medicago truncatula]RHN65906.1 putative proteinase inhibitor I13, potato inhibitor I [Medicago truncatula]